MKHFLGLNFHFASIFSNIIAAFSGDVHKTLSTCGAHTAKNEEFSHSFFHLQLCGNGHYNLLKISTSISANYYRVK